MSSRTSSRSPAGATPESWYLPLHQDAYFEALATGVVPIAEAKASTLSSVDQRLLHKEAHGFDYGVVGLLELAGAPTATGYTLLARCNAFWLRGEAERLELEGKLELFQDTVPDALPIRVDAGLFDAPVASLGVSNGELELSVNAAGLETPEPQSGQRKPRIVSLSGAISMARHRCLQLAIGVEYLPELFRVEGILPAHGRWGASFAGGVMGALLRSVAPAAHATKEEMLVIGEAAEMLSAMDPSLGIELSEFGSRLLDRCNGTEGASQAAAKFRETIARISDNQLELTTARIDDSGQIGLRALMVFLLAPEPDLLLRWLAARPDVGAGVSILASVFSGLYSGMAGVPRRVKAPSGPTFLATSLLAQSLLEGGDALSMEHGWSQDCEERRTIKFNGLVFAESVKKPAAIVTVLLAAVRAGGGSAMVDSDTGAIVLGLEGATGLLTAKVVVGASRWVGAGPVAELSIALRRPGRGAHPREFLERLLSRGIAPVAASLGDGPGEVELSTMVLLVGDDFIPAIRQALETLHLRAMDLGLVPPSQAPARKRAARKSTKEGTPAAGE